MGRTLIAPLHVDWSLLKDIPGLSVSNSGREQDAAMAYATMAAYLALCSQHLVLHLNEANAARPIANASIHLATMHRIDQVEHFRLVPPVAVRAFMLKAPSHLFESENLASTHLPLSCSNIVHFDILLSTSSTASSPAQSTIRNILTFYKVTSGSSSHTREFLPTNFSAHHSISLYKGSGTFNSGTTKELLIL